MNSFWEFPEVVGVDHVRIPADCLLFWRLHHRNKKYAKQIEPSVTRYFFTVDVRLIPRRNTENDPWSHCLHHWNTSKAALSACTGSGWRLVMAAGLCKVCGPDRPTCDDSAGAAFPRSLLTERCFVTCWSTCRLARSHGHTHVHLTPGYIPNSNLSLLPQPDVHPCSLHNCSRQFLVSYKLKCLKYCLGWLLLSSKLN